MDTTTKRVAIVGAGLSGLAACKHALAKGFRPVVFEAADAAGGVWTRTLASTRLQTKADAYRFSDFPWPVVGTTAAEECRCPRHDQVAAYLAAYARRFGVLECVRFRSRVLAADYVGAPEREVAAWERWSGNGEAFGDGTGTWHLAVQHAEPEGTRTYKFDFLILCVGRFGVPKVPAFPRNGGPEAFRGQVVHSMDYSRMPHADAAELVRGKRVAVVGGGKSGMDAVAQFAEANGVEYPSTLVYRSPRWMVDSVAEPSWLAAFQTITTTRFGELMVHKPGEGIALSLVATLLTPLRWVMAKLMEAYYKAHLPMRKHGMVPDHSYSQARSASWRIAKLPPRFYDRVEDGSVVLKRCDGAFSFCEDGLVLDGAGAGAGKRVAADLVILATGFDEDRVLRDVFASPRFREIVAAGPSDPMLPLYRHCVHPRIPQMAVVGYAESVTSIYPYEMMAKWVAHLLAGAVRLPSVAAMEASVAEWSRWAQQTEWSNGGVFYKSCIANVTTWYHDQLCRDMGYRPRRKRGGGRLLAEWLQPYGPTDYAEIQ